MNREEFQKILERYRHGNASKEEQILIEEWYEKIGTDDVQSGTAHSSLAEIYWKNIDAHMQASQRSRKRGKMRMLIHPTFLKIAASVIFFIGLTYFLYNGSTSENIASTDKVSNELKSILNTEAVVKQIALPDGTIIDLNPGSQIDFVEAFNSPTREVYLKGEAFFSVKRDVNRPFLVYSNEVVTKVLGTSFRIKALDDDNNVTVSVHTGKVCVYTKSDTEDDKDAVVIVPNQQIVFNRQKLEIKKGIVPAPIPIEEVQSTSIRAKFEGASVLHIFESIQEMYGLKIQADENTFKNCTLTTTLFEDELFKRLDIICKAIGATYRVEETTIIVEGPGCE